MTPAERQKRYRDRKRREREAAPERKREQRRTADRDRTTRAAVKVASDAGDADRPGSVVRSAGSDARRP